MRFLVTGVGGQLGADVMAELAARGFDAVGTDLAQANEAYDDYCPLDITDEAAVARTIREAAPDVVVHCAAWTAVDAAEDPENIPKVTAVNADGTRAIAKACAAKGCKLIYLSTDYVFDGKGSAPCSRTAPIMRRLTYMGAPSSPGRRPCALWSSGILSCASPGCSA